MRHAAIMLASLVAACNQPAPEPFDPAEAGSAAVPAPANAPGRTPPPSAGAQVSTLEGDWRVAGIDGADLNEVYGLALSADAEEIWWNPRCAGMIREYRIQDFGFSTHAVTQPAREIPLADSGAPPPPPAVCAIGLPPRLSEVMAALRVANRIERTRSNGVLLSGGGHSLLLFSQ